MTRLVEAQLAIHDAQSKYYWVPITSNIGPENGSTVQGVFYLPKFQMILLQIRIMLLLILKLELLSIKLMLKRQMLGTPVWAGLHLIVSKLLLVRYNKFFRR